MFNSISNWINTTLPQAIPPVSMPNIQMPDLFGKTKTENGEGNDSNELNKNENGEKVQQDQSQQTLEQQNGQQKQNQEASAAAEGAKENINEITLEPNDKSAADGATEKSNVSQLMGLNIELDAQKALGTAKEIGNNIGNMLFSFGKNASSNVMKSATHLKDVIEKKTLIAEFSKENEKFINDKKNQQRIEEAAVAPWVGYNEENKMKEQILALSSDTRNFLRSPPSGVDFNFDFNLAYPVALAILEEDNNLQEMRFKLVPKQINEENFWRNYFYRVSLVKQSSQLDQLNNESQIYDITPSKKNSSGSSNFEKTTKQDANSSNISNVESNNEFVSDSYDHETINDEEIQSELKQLKLDAKKNDDLEEWDKELPEDLDSISAEELEKEINQMIGK